VCITYVHQISFLFALCDFHLICVGNFYVNFKLVWDPITSLVVSHANGQESHKFWDTFSEQLKLACSRTAEAEDAKKAVKLTTSGSMDFQK